jgi:hypothetical protein
LSTHHLQFCSADQIRVDPTSVCRAGEEGALYWLLPASPQHLDQSLYHLELATTCQRHRQG